MHPSGLAYGCVARNIGMVNIPEITEEDANCFIETLKQAGVREHSRLSFDDGRVADIYDNDLLHTEVIRSETNGRKQVWLKVSGRKNGAARVVTEQDRSDAEIRPIERVGRPRPFGLAAGTFVVPDDFDSPLPEDILQDFEQ
jgi:hypothetical protein